jgi:hypothetical protein
MNWAKLLRTALYIQAAVATFLAIGMITGNIAPADIEPINGRKVAAFAFAYAITLVIVAGQFKNNSQWLLIPIMVTGINLIDTLFEFGVRRYYANFMPPMIIEPVFLLIYIVGYSKLNNKNSQSI